MPSRLFAFCPIPFGTSRAQFSAYSSQNALCPPIPFRSILPHSTPCRSDTPITRGRTVLSKALNCFIPFRPTPFCLLPCTVALHTPSCPASAPPPQPVRGSVPSHPAVPHIYVSLLAPSNDSPSVSCPTSARLSPSVARCRPAPARHVEWVLCQSPSVQCRGRGSPADKPVSSLGHSWPPCRRVSLSSQPRRTLTYRPIAPGVPTAPPHTRRRPKAPSRPANASALLCYSYGHLLGRQTADIPYTDAIRKCRVALKMPACNMT